MKNLLTWLFTIALVAHARASDIRIVNNARVDLAPLHEWLDSHDGKRPLPHWKEITLQEFHPGGPWPTCVIVVDNGGHKTVYLKNVPMAAVQAMNDMAALQDRVNNLSSEIASDTRRLRSAETVTAELDSEYDQNRAQFRVKLANKRDDLADLQARLDAMRAARRVKTSDFAMFTGQVYNSMEVWDCGQR